MEERFCNMVKEMGCTCVTISHRPALVAFHDMVSLPRKPRDVPAYLKYPSIAGHQ